MTDKTQAELRGAITEMVQVCDAGGTISHLTGENLIPTVTMWGSGLPEYKPLTPFQQMCLSGLIGDPSQLESAVVDYLLDQGHEYATAIREKEKVRIARLIQQERNFLGPSVNYESLMDEVLERPRNIYDEMERNR